MVKTDGRAILMDVGMTPIVELYVPLDGHRLIPVKWEYKPREQLLPLDNAEGPIVHTTAMDVCSFATTSYAVGPHPRAFPTTVVILIPGLLRQASPSPPSGGFYQDL